MLASSVVSGPESAGAPLVSVPQAHSATRTRATRMASGYGTLWVVPTPVNQKLLATDAAKEIQERFRVKGHTKDGMFEALATAFKKAHFVTHGLNQAEH